MESVYGIPYSFIPKKTHPKIVGTLFMYCRRIQKEHLYLLYSYDASVSELTRFFAWKKAVDNKSGYLMEAAVTHCFLFMFF